MRAEPDFAGPAGAGDRHVDDRVGVEDEQPARPCRVLIGAGRQSAGGIGRIDVDDFAVARIDGHGRAGDRRTRRQVAPYGAVDRVLELRLDRVIEMAAGARIDGGNFLLAGGGAYRRASYRTTAALADVVPAGEHDA